MGFVKIRVFWYFEGRDGSVMMLGLIIEVEVRDGFLNSGCGDIRVSKYESSLVL